MDNQFINKRKFELMAAIDKLRSAVNKMCSENGNNGENSELLVLSHKLDKLITEYMELTYQSQCQG